MHGFAHCLTSPSFLAFNPFTFPSTKSSYSPLVCRIPDGHNLERSVCIPSYRSDCSYRKKKKKKTRKKMMGTFRVRASGRESPYQVLGLSPSASTKDIKRAYRRLALKYHPDVNKEAGSKEKFMRIKHAYNTLLASKSRGKYDAENQGSDFSYSSTGGYQTKNREAEEEFYGFEDFFRDLQEEFRNWDATADAQGKPKSLWEELGEIGEEFVEFLEKELNITDADAVGNNGDSSSKTRYETKERARADQKEASDKGISIDDNIDEIEATLAQLKKELGL